MVINLKKMQLKLSVFRSNGRKRKIPGFEIHPDLEEGLESPLKSASWLSSFEICQLSSEGFYRVRQLLNYYPKKYEPCHACHDEARISVEGHISSICIRQRLLTVVMDRFCQIWSKQGSSLATKCSKMSQLKFLKVLKNIPEDYDNDSLHNFYRGFYNTGQGVFISGKVVRIGWTADQLLLDDSAKIIPSVNISDNEKFSLSGAKPKPIYSACGEFKGKEMGELLQEYFHNTCRFQVDESCLDSFSVEFREKYGLMELRQAYLAIHNPNTPTEIENGRNRLVFDEFFFHQLKILLSKQLAEDRRLAALGLTFDAVQQPNALPVKEWNALTVKLLTSLPYKLTRGQENVATEIMRDLRRPTLMNRLLQGDVGCGKTVVALLAIMDVVGRGYQGVIMAPTEFLAQQHFDRISELLERLPEEDRPCIEVLTGSTKNAKNVRLRVQAGEVKIIVGTHALISKGTAFVRLGLAVIDEQHRFGVKQRALLKEKGQFCPSEALEASFVNGVDGNSSSALPIIQSGTNILTMSATPIPRSLALALHGDMEISQIKELPPGRSPIITKLFLDGPKKRAEAYELLRSEVQAGGRAFVIFPLIDSSLNFPNRRSAESEYELLQKGHLKGLRCGLVHSRLTAEVNQDSMKRFQSGEFQVLISTTVVEVGIDVPEATVMLVENAECYGMAQLHQLRGRVGRGKNQSYCFLITDGENARSRLRTLELSQDGFHIAEADMHGRGHGELHGLKQSGDFPDFQLAEYGRDDEIMMQARKAAEEIMKEDRGLKNSPKLSKELTMRRLYIKS